MFELQLQLQQLDFLGILVNFILQICNSSILAIIGQNSWPHWKVLVDLTHITHSKVSSEVLHLLLESLNFSNVLLLFLSKLFHVKVVKIHLLIVNNNWTLVQRHVFLAVSHVVDNLLLWLSHSFIVVLLAFHGESSGVDFLRLFGASKWDARASFFVLAWATEDVIVGAVDPCVFFRFIKLWVLLRARRLILVSCSYSGSSAVAFRARPSSTASRNNSSSYSKGASALFVLLAIKLHVSCNPTLFLRLPIFIKTHVNIIDSLTSSLSGVSFGHSHSAHTHVLVFKLHFRIEIFIFLAVFLRAFQSCHSG